MLEVRAIETSFGPVKALDGISFIVEPGEIFGLIGPNGAGKTTAIRIVMNILSQDKGEVLFDGQAFTEADKDRIGYLPEDRGLYKKVKLGRMLRYLAELKGISRVQAEKTIDEWLERFDLMAWKDRKVEELSKGMSQKAQFIGAVAHNPDLLLFDEPFSGLDPISQELVLEAILDLKAAGKTILFSTHIMENAERICERILLIDKGKQVAYDKTAALKASYGFDMVNLEFDGDAAFIPNLDFVSSVVAYPRSMEIELVKNTDPDRLFRALAGKLRVRRFEVMEPSLRAIFLRLVGRPEAKTNSQRKETTNV